MTDYRNRPPVDAPRPTVKSVLLSTPVSTAILAAAGWVAIGTLGYAVCVALGLSFR